MEIEHLLKLKSASAAKAAWRTRVAAMSGADRAEFERRLRGELPKDRLAAAVNAVKEALARTPKETATRVADALRLVSTCPMSRCDHDPCP